MNVLSGCNRGEPIFSGKHGLREQRSERHRHLSWGWVSLFVDNITIAASNEDLRQLFTTVGVVVDVYISRKRRKNNNLRFAFVRYRKEEEGRRAIKEFDGKQLHDHPIRVSWARYGKGGSNTTPPRQSTKAATNRRPNKPAFRDGRRYNEVVLGNKRPNTMVNRNIQNIPNGTVSVEQKQQNRVLEGNACAKQKTHNQVILNVCENLHMRNGLKYAAVIEFTPPMDCVKATDLVNTMHLQYFRFCSAISPLKLALFFEDGNGLEIALDESSPLRKAFSNVRKWSDNESCLERAVWLECTGLHPYCWSEENLIKIGNVWGKTITVVDVFNGVHSISSAKILIITKKMGRIEERVKIVAEHGAGVIWVKESQGCACMGNVNGKDDEQDLEVDTQNGGVLGDEQQHGHDGGIVVLSSKDNLTENGDENVEQNIDTREQGIYDQHVEESGEENDNLGHETITFREDGFGTKEVDNGQCEECVGQDDFRVMQDQNQFLQMNLGQCGIDDHNQLTLKENIRDGNEFDPIYSVEVAISLQMAENTVVCSAPNNNHTSTSQQNSRTQKRPRGRPKRAIHSLPEPLFVPSTPSNGTAEAIETWNTVKRLGVRASNDGVVLRL